MTLREHLNLDGASETHIFLQGTKNKTPQMKYNQFVDTALEKFNPIIRSYLNDVIDPQMKECVTVKQIEELKLPALPGYILDKIIDHVDKIKSLNIVEKTYLALDLVRAVSTNLGTTIGNMAMHYANAIQAAPKIIQQNGKSY